jgi:hypothetical protein
VGRELNEAAVEMMAPKGFGMISHKAGGNRLLNRGFACPIFLGVEESGCLILRGASFVEGFPEER